MKYIILAIALASVQYTSSQTMPGVIDSIGTGYMDMARIHPSYIAGLREGMLDIREASFNSLGTLSISVPLNGIPIMGGFLETTNNTIYTIGDSITNINVSNPSAPFVETVMPLPEQAVATYLWNDLLIVSCNNYYTYVYDINTAATPLLIDSVNITMQEICGKGNKLYTRNSYGTHLYSWNVSASAPYLTLSDSFSLSSNPTQLLSLIVVNNQLIVKKSTELLYRFDLNAPADFSLLATEPLPSYPYNGGLVAIDTNYIGYAKYNSFSLSYGHTGNSFVDSLDLWFPNYMLGYGRLDNSIFYGDVGATRLIGWESITGINEGKNKLDVVLYPNPVNNYLYIQTHRTRKYVYQLLDINGKTTAQGTFENAGKIIDVQYLPAGTYLLQLQNGEGQTLTKKISKR